jgi:ubiquinone/menaquinone biosynthesis C-methylase UbiE
MTTQAWPESSCAQVEGDAPIRDRAASGTFLQFQYDDLATKGQDVYANTKYAILRRFLEGKKPLRILNVGCGSGELSLQLAELGHQVLGVDIEPAHIELARRNAAMCDSGANCEFMVCGVEEMEFDNEVDCLVSTDMLEHVQDDRAAFAKMMQALKPAGMVLLAVPAGQWLFGFHDEQLGHFRRYSKKTLLELVEPRCRVDVVRHFGFTLVPVCLVYSRWMRRPYPVAESGDMRQRPVRALVLRSLMQLDRWTRMPFGTSLLLKGRKK